MAQQKRKDYDAFRIRWMNKTRYKDARGKLIIHSTQTWTEEELARKAFENYTKGGFACQLQKCRVVMCDRLNFETMETTPGEYLHPGDVIEENGRWKIRFRESELARLNRKKAALEKELASVQDQINSFSEG